MCLGVGVSSFNGRRGVGGGGERVHVRKAII